MHLEILEHNDIDKQRWDACLSDWQIDLVYPQSWYLDIVAPDWKAVVYGDYKGMMPLPVNRKFFGFVQMYQPFFAQQLGYFGQPLPQEMLWTLLQKYFIRVHFYGHATMQLSSYKKLRHNYKLTLADSYNQIKTGYSSSLRRNLRKAAITLGDLEWSEAVDFYLRQAKTLFGLTDFQARLVQSICRESQKRKQLLVHAAYYNDEIVGVFVAVEHRQRLFNLFSIVNDLGRKQHAHPVLLDHVIQTYAGQAITLDFEGSEITGIADFYKRFGTEAELYPEYVFYRHKWVQVINQWRKKI